MQFNLTLILIADMSENPKRNVFSLMMAWFRMVSLKNTQKISKVPVNPYTLPNKSFNQCGDSLSNEFSWERWGKTSVSVVFNTSKFQKCISHVSDPQLFILLGIAVAATGNTNEGAVKEVKVVNTFVNIQATSNFIIPSVAGWSL